ncbi:MAG: CRISPR-associated endonuclease Cas1 [Candidatus Helarchaeota archaeon]
MGLSYLGEAAVESQVDFDIAIKLTKFFSKGNKPPINERIKVISELASAMRTKEDTRFQEQNEKEPEYLMEKRKKIQELLENYRWNEETAENYETKKGFYEGDLETYRRTCIWLAIALFLFFEGSKIHEYVITKEDENYYEVDYSSIYEIHKQYFNSFNEIYKRYQKVRTHITKRRPGIRHHKTNWKKIEARKPDLDDDQEGIHRTPSQLTKKIYDLLDEAGKNGMTVNESYMKIYGNITHRKINWHLQKLRDKTICIKEYGMVGKPPYRYFLKKYLRKPKYQTCEDCQELIKLDKRKTVNCKYTCRLKDKARTPKQKACEHYKELERKHKKFKYFEIQNGKPRCPQCNELDTLKIPEHQSASICKNCHFVVYEGKKGMYEGKTGIYEHIQDKVKAVNGYLVAKVKNYKYNIKVKKGQKLTVEYDTNKQDFRFKVSGRKRRYFLDSVSRIELIGGEIDSQAESYAELYEIEVIRHSKKDVDRAEKRLRSENKIRNKLRERRAKGDLIEIGRQWTIAKIMSDFLYSDKLIQTFIHEIDRPYYKKKYEHLLYGQLDWLIRTYEFYNPQNTLQKKEEITKLMNRFRSVEGNAEKYAWEIIKRALPTKYTFVGRQAQRYAETIFYYGGKAYDVFNACLNYLYILLQMEAGKALGEAGFNQFYPGPGILHYRISSGKPRKKESFKNIMTKKNKELIFDFMDGYRPPFRYYLVKAFIDGKISKKHVWKGKDELGRELFYVSSKCKAKAILDELFRSILAKNFYYKNHKFMLSTIMSLEAKNFAQFIKSKKTIEYVPYCAFETRKEARWVFNIVYTIDSILGNGNIPQYIELEPNDVKSRDDLLKNTVKILDYLFGQKKKFDLDLDQPANVCIVTHVDIDGFKSALNLAFLHQGKNNNISIFPASNRYGYNYVEKVIEEKVLKNLEKRVMNYIYVADIPFLSGRETFIEGILEKLEYKNYKFKFTWFDHHPTIESKKDLRNIKKLFKKYNGDFIYSRFDEAHDIIFNFVSNIVNKEAFFKKFGRNDLKNFDIWFKKINKKRYIRKWFRFYELYLYQLFKGIKERNLTRLFLKASKYKKPKETRELQRFLKRRVNLLANPEKYLYFYEFGKTIKNFNYIAFEFKKNITMNAFTEFFDNIKGILFLLNPIIFGHRNNRDLLLCCWTNKEISIRASKKINLHTMFDKSCGHKRALGILDLVENFECIDTWYDRSATFTIKQYITFAEFLNRIKIADLSDSQTPYKEDLATQRIKLDHISDDYLYDVHMGLYSNGFKTNLPIDNILEDRYFRFGTCNLIFYNQYHSKALMDVICYLMLTMQRTGSHQTKVLCIYYDNFPFYQNLLAYFQHYNYSIHNLKNIIFLKVAKLDDYELIFDRIVSLIEQFNIKLIIIDSLFMLIREYVQYGLRNVKVSELTRNLRKIAKKTETIILLTYIKTYIKKKEIMEIPYPSIVAFDNDLKLELSREKQIIMKNRLYGWSCTFELEKEKLGTLALCDFSYPHILKETKLHIEPAIEKVAYYLEGMNIYGHKYVLVKFNEVTENKDLIEAFKLDLGQDFNILLWEDEGFQIYPNQLRLNSKLLENLGGREVEKGFRFYKSSYKYNFKSFEQFFIHFLNTDITTSNKTLKDVLHILDNYTSRFSSFNLYEQFKNQKIYSIEYLRHNEIKGIHPITKRKFILEINSIFKGFIYNIPKLRVKWYNFHIELLKYLDYINTDIFFNLLIESLKKYKHYRRNRIKTCIEGRLKRCLHKAFMYMITTNEQFDLNKIYYFIEELTPHKFRKILQDYIRGSYIEFNENQVFFKSRFHLSEFLNKLKIDLLSWEIQTQKEIYLDEVTEYFNHVSEEDQKKLISIWLKEGKFSGEFEGNIFRIDSGVEVFTHYLTEFLRDKKYPDQFFEIKLPEEEPEEIEIPLPEVKKFQLIKNKYGNTFLFLQFRKWFPRDKLKDIKVERDIDFCYWVNKNVNIYAFNALDENLEVIKYVTGSRTLNWEWVTNYVNQMVLIPRDYQDIMMNGAKVRKHYTKDEEVKMDKIVKKLFENICNINLAPLLRGFQDLMYYFEELTMDFFEKPPNIEIKRKFDDDVKEKIVNIFESTWSSEDRYRETRKSEWLDNLSFLLEIFKPDKAEFFINSMIRELEKLGSEGSPELEAIREVVSNILDRM